MGKLTHMGSSVAINTNVQLETTEEQTDTLSCFDTLTGQQSQQQLQQYSTCNGALLGGDGGSCRGIAGTNGNSHISRSQGYEVIDAIPTVHACLAQPLQAQ